ncbi:MAG: Ldh family oxidoreductase [Synergistaceae bacterium]|jgi:LDH2 family malate/lactate/ureidoglycolate dehydrogenase|nr:Ldh family oxidoreductase [Synergistaceae bacterium]
MPIKLAKEKLMKFCNEVFLASGLQADHAAIVADNLMSAELRGVRSHGLMQMRIYLEGLKTGEYNKRPQVKVLRETSSTLLVDGDFGPGSISGNFAMKKCIDKAKVTGAAGVGVTNGTHFGMAAYYAMEALPYDMIGFAFCNAKPRVAVYGGIDAQMGTNPICVAVPSFEELPVVYDGATTQAAWNKIRYRYKEAGGRETGRIDKGLALDKNGNDTDDPMKAEILLPFAEHKGSGLAIIVNSLCSLLTGAAICADPETGEPLEKVGRVGFYFGALDIAAFQEPLFFKKSMDLMIRRMKSSKKKAGQKRIYMPGELESIKHAEQSANGVELGEAVFAELSDVGSEFGVTL